MNPGSSNDGAIVAQNAVLCARLCREAGLNLKHFMNGVLGGVPAPARLIHGWESTFCWGGQRYLGGDVNDPKSYTHYSGDRTARHRVRLEGSHDPDRDGDLHQRTA